METKESKQQQSIPATSGSTWAVDLKQAARAARVLSKPKPRLVTFERRPSKGVAPVAKRPKRTLVRYLVVSTVVIVVLPYCLNSLLWVLRYVHIL
jgi:hypothetical protein